MIKGELFRRNIKLQCCVSREGRIAIITGVVKGRIFGVLRRSTAIGVVATCGLFVAGLRKEEKKKKNQKNPKKRGKKTKKRPTKKKKKKNHLLP